MTLFLIFLLCFFIFGSAFLSASETALFSLSPMKVRIFKQSESRSEMLIGQLLSSPRDLLVTILMLNILMNLLVQNTISSLLGTYSGWLLTAGFPLALTLVFGEVIPKTLSLSANEAVAHKAARPLNLIFKMMSPVFRFLSYISSMISRFLFFFLKKEPEITTEQMKIALQTSRDFGILSRDEAKLIRGYVNLVDDQVKNLMRPKEEILFYDLKMPLSNLMSLFVEKACSRVPVCEDNLENLKGILSCRQFFINQASIQKPEDLLPFLSKIFYIPETMQAKALLKQMKQKKHHMAMVLDEYKMISGLITYEDLFEVIVGQIAHKRDEKVRYTRANSDVIIASGKLELDQLEELFDVHLESKSNMVTIGGWLIEKMGDIPKTGTKLETHGFLFHVLAADPNRVRRVYIRKLSKKSGLKKSRDIG